MQAYDWGSRETQREFRESQEVDFIAKNSLEIIVDFLDLLQEDLSIRLDIIENNIFQQKSRSFEREDECWSS